MLIHSHLLKSLRSSSDGNAPYEDFHEKYISYKHEPFRIRSVSFEEKPERDDKEEIPLERQVFSFIDLS